MNNRPKFKIALIIICFIFYSYTAISHNNWDIYNININTGKPLTIESPAEIAIVGDEGEKGFRIGPNIGRGWLEEAGGKANYKFFIPQDGKYHIWAYCLWYDVCANAVFVKIDDNDKIIIGNDPIYEEWHWVRGPNIYLNKGTHDLELSNHSDHIAIQKIFFSNSISVEPQMEGIIFSDIFYDGFDGCNQGNFANWQQIKGTWQAISPETEDNIIAEDNYLIGESLDEAFISYQNEDWQNYCLDVMTKIQPVESNDCSIGICFGLTDPNNFNQVQIKPIINSNEAEIFVFDNNKEILSETKVTFEIDKWQHIQISLKDNNIEITLAENNPISIEISEEIKGGIGFKLEGNIIAYFDNIHVMNLTSN